MANIKSIWKVFTSGKTLDDVGKSAVIAMVQCAMRCVLESRPSAKSSLLQNFGFSDTGSSESTCASNVFLVNMEELEDFPLARTTKQTSKDAAKLEKCREFYKLRYFKQNTDGDDYNDTTIDK